MKNPNIIYSCPKLKKPPYVCNACKERSKCALEKAFYRTVEDYQKFMLENPLYPVRFEAEKNPGR